MSAHDAPGLDEQIAGYGLDRMRPHILASLTRLKQYDAAAGELPEQPEYADRHNVGAPGGSFVAHADYSDLYFYCNKIRSRCVAAENLLRAHQIRPRGKSVLPYIMRAEKAEASVKALVEGMREPTEAMRNVTGCGITDDELEIFKAMSAELLRGTGEGK